LVLSVVVVVVVVLLLLLLLLLQMLRMLLTLVAHWLACAVSAQMMVVMMNVGRRLKRSHTSRSQQRLQQTCVAPFHMSAGGCGWQLIFWWPAGS
jgi:hypothetical protein